MVLHSNNGTGIAAGRVVIDDWEVDMSRSSGKMQAMGGVVNIPKIDKLDILNVVVSEFGFGVRDGDEVRIHGGYQFPLEMWT